MTVRRRLTLLPHHEVSDADDDPVGVVALPWLLDRWGRPAVQVREGRQGNGLFVAGGEAIGEWRWIGRDALRLEVENVPHDPFLKMLLLGAALQAVQAPAAAG
jgi:hypothetical protein